VKNFEMKAQNWQGERRWFSTSIYLLEIGNVLCDISVSIDVTDRKKAEIELLEINRELESFSYSVSHDLRAPLRAINGYAKILEEDHSAFCDDDGKNSLEAIKSNSKKMGELIDALLAFSRLGKNELIVSEINMTALVKNLREEELQGNSNNMDFIIPELLPAKGDQILIKQVWVNLISNAVKYSKHKPITKIEIGSTLKDNFVVYYVKDHGAGFDMQYYNKLFGVFQRLHSQEEFEGTGIGLAIVQKIVQKHEGKVWAESILNEGSSFYFSLPKINSN
jgi:light-regulated signal transduction histidine kinase (bacteriophytochrome)